MLPSRFQLYITVVTDSHKYQSSAVDAGMTDVKGDRSLRLLEVDSQEGRG